jgi:FdhD protein
MNGANQAITYYQVDANQCKRVNAEIIVETPVSLTINGEVWLSFMCTPVDLEAMAVGFLFNEGLIQSVAEVESVRLCPAGDNIDIWLSHEAIKPSAWRRTSGCTGGVTAVEEDFHISDLPARIYNGVPLTSKQVGDLIDQLFESQNLYRKSGGVHTSALSDGQRIQVIAEDIGRHNTLDKIAGRCLLEGIHLPRRVLLTTGRISSEMLQKAVRLGAAIVISRTSPSSLSIKLAENYGITLIGYARRTSFRVYTHPERIIIPHSPSSTPSETAIEEPCLSFAHDDYNKPG